MQKFISNIVLILCLWATPIQATTITDSDGTKISFNKPFTRIISLYAAHTENLLALGLRNEIIATSRSDTILERPRLGYRDDPERFIALKPDLLLIRPMISRAYPQLVTRLQKRGITVVSLQPVSVDELFDYWQVLGQLTGRERQAEEMVDAFTIQLAAMKEKVAAIDKDQRKRVYFEAIHRRMKTFAPTSMAMFVLSSAGGINVATDTLQLRNTNIAQYGKERILARANEIDIFLAQQGRMNPVQKEDIINEPGFQVIKAVREGKVYIIDESIVSRPTMGLLKGMETIYDILYNDK
jgi:iron complex transport system substrate-binding protein